MLAVPFVAGAVLGGFDAWQVVLLPAWMFAYCAAYHAQQYVRLRRVSRNPRAARRHVAPLAGFGVACAALAAAPVVARPWLIVAGVCAAPFFALNIYFAYRNEERSIVNGIIAVLPASGMLLVTFRLGHGSLNSVAWTAAAACLLYFAGTVLHVKAMIRERGNRAYRTASGIYHGVAVTAATALHPLLSIPFLLYFLRALALPARGVRVAVVGALEVVGSVLLLATLPLVG